MDSPRNWPHLFTGICTLIGALLSGWATYFFADWHASKQNDKVIASLEQRLAIAESSTPHQAETRTPDSFEKDRASLRNRIAELQAQLSTEQRYREEAEQEFQKLKGTDSSRQEKINNLQSRLTEEQNALDSLKARYASQEQQLKKFSEESQRRLDRARTNYLARRWQRYPAPDGSNRNFVIVYDENGPDILPAKVRARFEAGQ